MEAQQFHLKWNNHSLNTLSSFQHLLDTHCLVDVSLTCSTGKTVPAHRMVLAACSDYFYRLFKDLPEKHPVIVFKDASEQILNDLLEFMYRGEVEVDDSNLSDFLKFADTLQVKGLSQGEGAAGALRGGKEQEEKPGSVAGDTSSPRDTPPISVKDPAKLGATSIPDSVANLNKAYHFSNALAGLSPVAGAGKFPPFFPALPNGDPASDIYQSLTSPNLFNALKRKYPVALGQKPAGLDLDNPVLKMPFLKDYFGKHALPVDLSYGTKEEDSDDIADHSPSPTEMTENGNDDNNRSLDLASNDDKSSTTGSNGGRKPTGRGSRLERMIAAEYKILSEYSENQNGVATDNLPAITPELMKSRRTHSLQLAIGEILNNRASVQSAATKYHIPRETLRRHYQRYLKAMGINKAPEPQRGGSNNTSNNDRQTSTPTKSSIDTLAAAAVAAAAANAAGANQDDAAARYSSLLDIGQAYGIWNPTEDNSNDNDNDDQKDLKIVEDDEETASSDKETEELKSDLKEKVSIKSENCTHCNQFFWKT